MLTFDFQHLALSLVQGRLEAHQLASQGVALEQKLKLPQQKLKS